VKYPECSSKIGRFELTGVLGSGGQGRIYKAYDSSMNRNVALKVLNPSLCDDPVVRKRFDEEINHLASQNIPGVITVFDKGEDSNWLYYTMELVDGATIDSFFKDAGLTIVAKFEYLAKLARTIKLLHKQGICHRDVKPSNVMIDTNDEVKLLDFGIAKNTQVTDPQLTRPGQCPGSPLYMAPEQIVDQGSQVQLSDSDIFAFGTLIYEVLTGQLPYDVEFLHPDEIYAVMSSATIEPLCSFDKTIPGEVNSLVLRMLSVNAIERPTASEVEETLRKHSVVRQDDDWRKYAVVAVITALVVIVMMSNSGSSLDSPRNEYYTIKKGDTLYGIAISENVNAKELLKLNKLNKNSVLRIGQILRLPPELSEDEKPLADDITQPEK